MPLLPSFCLREHTSKLSLSNSPAFADPVNITDVELNPIPEDCES